LSRLKDTHTSKSDQQRRKSASTVSPAATTLPAVPVPKQNAESTDDKQSLQLKTLFGTKPANDKEGFSPVQKQATNSAVLQGKFNKEQRRLAIEDLDRIEEFLKTRAEAKSEKIDRSSHKDMALGVTELRKNHLKSGDQRDLFEWMKAAQEDGEEAEILERCQQLLVRAEGKANNNNLRIFGDVVGASTWMDWIPVNPTIQGQYRTWFTECATKPLLSNDGRFKFNLSGFDHEYCQQLVVKASKISQKEMDRMVDEHEISKTDWEILEVLSNISLFEKTDFLLFDKTEDDEPLMMKEELKKTFAVDKPITLLDENEFKEHLLQTELLRIQEQENREKKEEESNRFKISDKNERIELLKLRYEKELEGTGKDMEDTDVRNMFDEACEEADWPWNNFEEWWDNGSGYFFNELKK